MTQLSPASAERLRQAFLHCRDMEGSLRERLEAYAAAGRDIFPAYSDAVDRLVERLKQNGGGNNAPRPGDMMPPFMLPDERGQLVTLPALLRQGPVIAMFFRGHWCPYCLINVGSVVKALADITALGSNQAL